MVGCTLGQRCGQWQACRGAANAGQLLPECGLLACSRLHQAQQAALRNPQMPCCCGDAVKGRQALQRVVHARVQPGAIAARRPAHRVDHGRAGLPTGALHRSACRVSVAGPSSVLPPCPVFLPCGLPMRSQTKPAVGPGKACQIRSRQPSGTTSVLCALVAVWDQVSRIRGIVQAAERVLFGGRHGVRV